MREFFKYDDPFKNPEIYHTLTTLEWIMPLIIVFISIFLIILYKNKLRQQKKLDRYILYALGSLEAFFYIMGYTLKWSTDGINVSTLPFHLCSISMLLTTILAFTRNKKILYFVLFTGVLGGLGSLLTPDVGYSYQYFKYYQFMGGHALIIIVPLYMLIVHRYIPNIKDTIRVMIIVQILAIFMTIFNTIFKTNYMYITIGADVYHEGTLLTVLGKYPWYLVNLELLAIALFLLWHGIIYIIYREKTNDEIEEQIA